MLNSYEYYMDSRSAKLLYELIVEYIATAQPVGSHHLQEIAGLSFSPATIRNLLRGLEEEGYIEQPHTSAGRIPTTKGYRWYVNHLVRRDLTTKRLRTLAERYHSLQGEHDALRVATKFLSELTKTLAITGRVSPRGVYDSGLPWLLEQPEGEQLETVREVTNFADDLDEYVDQFARDARQQVVVYIGSENPAYEAEHMSVLARAVTLPNQQEAVLLVVGPKRMPYARHTTALEAMARIMQHQI